MDSTRLALLNLKNGDTKNSLNLFSAEFSLNSSVNPESELFSRNSGIAEVGSKPVAPNVGQ